MNRRGLLTAAWTAALAAASADVMGAVTPAAAGRVVVASQYGAVGDGSADDTRALQAALDAAFGGTPALLVIPPGVYRIADTLRARVNSAVSHPCGISARGAHVMSQMRGGQNLFELVVGAAARFVLIEGLDLLGTGRDGHGIYVDCDSPTASLENFCLRDVVIQYCGADGARLAGNASEGQIVNSYFRNNRANGMTLANGRAGPISSVNVFGCVFGDNQGHGAALLDGCAGGAFHGCYFLLNGAFGLAAESGCTLLSNCGFENNHQAADTFEHGDAGLRLGGFGTLVGCMAYSMLKQTHLIRASLSGELVMVGCSGSGDAQARNAGLARLAGADPASATLIGCSGAVACEGGFEALEIAAAGGGVRFGSDWRSRNLPRLGDYYLWVDGRGRLRSKKGRPAADDDGTPVGA